MRIEDRKKMLRIILRLEEDIDHQLHCLDDNQEHLTPDDMWDCKDIDNWQSMHDLVMNLYDLHKKIGDL